MESVRTKPVAVAPPAPQSIVRMPHDARPVLVVVVDTEEEFDWSKPFDRANVDVSYMREIGRLQRVFDDFHIRPVYVIDHPIATHADSYEPLREIQASGRAEIGAHMHPWLSPPFDEQVDAHHSYSGNLPRDLERAKLVGLTREIEENIGTRPLVYKAGRYGFGANTASILEELGFEVDLSLCPAFDFSSDGGPDYSNFGPEPSWFGSRSQMLAIPTTGAFVGFAGERGNDLYRLACKPIFARLRAQALLARSRAVERMLLSPEGFRPDDHRRLTYALLERGVRTFTFNMHSSSIQPGSTPYVRNERDRAQFLASCRQYFDFFLNELHGVSRTALELKRQLCETRA
jgi:hypothetical protein